MVRIVKDSSVNIVRILKIPQAAPGKWRGGSKLEAVESVQNRWEGTRTKGKKSFCWSELKCHLQMWGDWNSDPLLVGWRTVGENQSQIYGYPMTHKSTLGTYPREVSATGHRRTYQECSRGNSLAVQWLGLRASTAGNTGSSPGLGRSHMPRSD